MKLSQAKPSATQSVLVFGPPKCGKTQLVGQLATKYKLIWFDLENGSATLHKLPPEAQDRVELISLPDSRSYPIAIETLYRDWETDRKSTRLNSSHSGESRMPSSA